MRKIQRANENQNQYAVSHQSRCFLSEEFLLHSLPRNS